MSDFDFFSTAYSNFLSLQPRPQLSFSFTPEGFEFLAVLSFWLLLFSSYMYYRAGRRWVPDMALCAPLGPLGLSDPISPWSPRSITPSGGVTALLPVGLRSWWKAPPHSPSSVGASLGPLQERPTLGLKPPDQEKEQKSCKSVIWCDGNRVPPTGLCPT